MSASRLFLAVVLAALYALCGCQPGASSSPGDSSTPGDSAQGDSANGDGRRSVRFVTNLANQHDYGRLTDLPAGFGVGEFTFEMWIRPENLPRGECAGGSAQLTEWCTQDNPPYDPNDGGWWYKGNFLLDGHNNSSCFCDGTFSLQFYGSGRLRWLFGDGVSPDSGGVWSVGAYPATDGPDIVDDQWHQVTCVRRWAGTSESDLELWIDGVNIATERTPSRTDMRTFWDSWTGFGAAQAGWFFGAEKQAAIGVLAQYEDFKGDIAEIRFWSRAKTPTELSSDYNRVVTGDEPGLEARIPFAEASGPACDESGNTCISWTAMSPGFRRADGPPLVP